MRVGVSKKSGLRCRLGIGALLLPCRVLRTQRVGKQLFDRRDPALIEVPHEIDRIQSERTEADALTIAPAVQKQSFEFVQRKGKINGSALFDDDMRLIGKALLAAVQRREVKSDAAVLDADLLDGNLADRPVSDR